MSLFRSLRQLVREYLSFGNEEISQLKSQLEKQRAQLQQLKAMRELRQQQEENLALMELRRAVGQLQAAEAGRPAQAEAVVEAVGALGDKMQRMMEDEMKGRAAGVLQSIDFEEVLTGSGEVGVGSSSGGGGGGGAAAEAAAAAAVPAGKLSATKPRKPRGRKPKASKDPYAA